MQDALLCYYMILNMRHAGHFLVVAELFRRAIASLQRWRAPAPLNRRGTVLATGRAASPISVIQEDWTRRLVRLENYVAAMA